MKHFFLLLPVSVCLFQGCKKDKDETEPVVTISSPYYNQNFSVFDTVKVTANISDETQLKSVQVSLQDLNNVNVLEAVPVSVSSNPFSFSLDYILHDIHLSSGQYKIAVTASDGENTEVHAVIINITEVPLTKKYFYVATNSTLSSVITRYDSVFMNPILLNFNAEVNSLAVSSWHQRLFLMPEKNASLNAYRTDNHQQLWSIQDFGAGYPYFSCFGKNDDQTVTVGYFDGRLMRYNQSGATVANYQTGSTTYYPAFTYTSGDYVFVSMKDQLSTASEFKRFGNATGAQQSVAGTNWTAVGMGDKSSTEFYVAGNVNTTGQGVLNICYSNAGGFYTPITLPTGSVLSAVGIDSDYFLIAHSNGTIYRYQYSTNSLVPIQTGFSPTKMKYNATFNELTFAQGNLLYVFNVAPYALQVKNVYTHTGVIDDFETVYNR